MRKRLVAIRSLFLACIICLWACGISTCNGPPERVSDPSARGDGGAGTGSGGLLEPFPAQLDCGPERQLGGPVDLPRNIILVMGDGMGPYQIAAGRMAAGGPVAWDDFRGPVYVNSDSLTTDRAADPSKAPTDSAAAATAMATGVRVLNGVVSVDSQGVPLTTVLELAKAEGKAVGVVTNSYLYDASPMAFAAHAPARGMHDVLVDGFLSGSRPDVIMGGALDFFSNRGGMYEARAVAAGYHVVHDAAELAAWDPAEQPRLLGLFQGSFAPLNQWPMTPAAKRTEASTDPELATMTQRALERLAADPDGFFLLVENEHTDTASHLGAAAGDLMREIIPPEVLALSAAVEVITTWVRTHSSFSDTLLVITADHETGGMQIQGDELAADSVTFATSGHTRTPVPLWAMGPGSQHIEEICRISDVFGLLTGQLE